MIYIYIFNIYDSMIYFCLFSYPWLVAGAAPEAGGRGHGGLRPCHGAEGLGEAAGESEAATRKNG